MVLDRQVGTFSREEKLFCVRKHSHETVEKNRFRRIFERIGDWIVTDKAGQDSSWKPWASVEVRYGAAQLDYACCF